MPHYFGSEMLQHVLRTLLTPALPIYPQQLMLPRMYYQKWAKVDEEDFDAVALLKEGLQPAVGIFFASWVLTYTLCHVNASVPDVAGSS